MSESLQISEAESIVMEVLWKEHPLSAEQVVAALAKTQSWQEPTVKTLLNRLLKKHAVRATRDGRRYLYTPAIERAQWQGTVSEGFVDRVFGGRLVPLVVHFGRHGRLSAQELEELRRLIDEISDDVR